MSKRTYLHTIFLLFLTFPLRAQVTVEAQMDSAQIWIGQQVGMTVRVSVGARQQVEWPRLDSLQQLVPGVEVAHVGAVDTAWLNERERMTLSRRYLLTSFDSALYYLPPMQVKVDGKTYQSKSLALKVFTLDIDTLHADSIFGLKEIMKPPFVWCDYYGLIWMTLVALLLIALLAYVEVRLKQNKPIIRRIRTKKKLPPHEVAMEKLGRIKAERMEQAEDSKEYYTALTDALREYIQQRYGFSALEMTTGEIITKLQDVNDKDAVAELRELFETADLVKFAKYSTLMNENDRNLVNAIEYVNATKVVEVEKQQPEEVVVVDKRSRKAHRLLVGSIVAVSLLLLYILVRLGYRLWVLLG